MTRKRKATSPASMQDALMRSHIEERTEATIGLGGDWELPRVEVPAIDDVVVEVVAPTPPSAEELKRAFGQLLRAYAKVSARSPGDQVLSGDEVLVSYGASIDGKPIPFLVAVEQWLPLWPQPPFEQSLANQVIGHKVSSRNVVGLVLSDTYPVEALRGKTAQVTVEIHAARFYQPVREDDPKFLEWTGLGATVEAVMDGIGARLVQARELELRNTAVGRVLEELAHRAGIVIPNETIDRAIRDLWLEAEGKHFVEWGVPLEQAAGALQGWLGATEVRESVARWLACLAVTRAVAEASGIDFEKQQIVEQLGEISGAKQWERERVDQALGDYPQAYRLLNRTFQALRTTDLIMSKARVTIKAPKRSRKA